MTIITAKPYYPPIRAWQGNKSIFAETASGEFYTLSLTNPTVANRFSNEPLFTAVWEMPTENNWFISTYYKMVELLARSDIGITGANPTDPSAIEHLLSALLRILPDDACPPAIVPTWLGGVQAEWHRNGVDLEISANPGAVVEYYFSDGDDEREGIVKDDWANLINYARKIV